MNLEEHHHQSEQREGLDKSQAEHQEQKDTGARARVASQRLDCRADSFALTKSAQPCGKPHGHTNANRSHVDRGRAAISEDRDGKTQYRQGDKYELKFTHSSPAS